MAGERLPGPKIPFYAPFEASKRAQADNYAAPLDKVFARVLCKDSIGLWLGWIPAPYRISRFDDKPGGTVAANAGRNFAINEQVAANPFKLFLKPGTKIRGQKMDFSLGTSPAPSDFPVKSISIWMPGHVTITQVLFWINGNLRNYTKLDGTVSQNLPPLPDGITEQTVAEHLGMVMAVVTPNERKYNVRTPLLPKARPMIIPTATPSPSPSPGPTA